MHMTVLESVRKTLGCMLFLILIVIWLIIPATAIVITGHSTNIVISILSTLLLVFYVMFSAFYMFGGRNDRFSKLFDKLLGD